MNDTQIFLDTVQDHIMANTWLLIFEQNSLSEFKRPQAMLDFARLVEVLPEYRLIGLHLAQTTEAPGRPV